MRFKKILIEGNESSKPSDDVELYIDLNQNKIYYFDGNELVYIPDEEGGGGGGGGFSLPNIKPPQNNDNKDDEKGDGENHQDDTSNNPSNSSNDSDNDSDKESNTDNSPDGNSESNSNSDAGIGQNNANSKTPKTFNGKSAKEIIDELENEARPKSTMSKEERAERLAKIKSDLDDPDGMLDKIDIDNIRASATPKKPKVQTRDTIKELQESIEDLLSYQVAYNVGDAWDFSGMSTLDPDMAEKNMSFTPSRSKPVVNVYFDRSASWGDPRKTDIGWAAVNTLDEFESQGLIEYHVYFFNTSVFWYDEAENQVCSFSSLRDYDNNTIKGRTSYADASTDWFDENKNHAFGGTEGTPVSLHIKSTEPDNIIIMTDGDTAWDTIVSYQAPGAVWYIEVDGVPTNMVANIRGDLDTQEFKF